MAGVKEVAEPTLSDQDGRRRGAGLGLILFPNRSADPDMPAPKPTAPLDGKSSAQKQINKRGVQKIAGGRR